MGRARLVPLAVVLALLSGCEDPDDGAARLDAAVPVVDREGESLGEALSETLGGTSETGPTEYDLCISSPTEGLRYHARWRIRDADPTPTLAAVTRAAAEAGWEVGDTSPAEGQLSESAALSRAGIDTRISIDDGVIGWRSQSGCIRVTPEEASKRVGPAS